MLISEMAMIIIIEQVIAPMTNEIKVSC